MEININSTNESALIISVPTDLPLEEKREWDKFKKEVLSYAFLNKYACMITLSPENSSLGQILGGKEIIKVNNETLLINTIANCEDNLFDSIIDEDEFDRDLLWFTSIKTNDKDKIISLIKSHPVPEFGIPNTKEELLFCDGDGSIITWVNPKYGKEKALKHIDLLRDQYTQSF